MDTDYKTGTCIISKYKTTTNKPFEQECMASSVTKLNIQKLMLYHLDLTFTNEVVRRLKLNHGRGC